jgi:23S rRNA (uracil1939-C5)-methyltransferase
LSRRNRRKLPDTPIEASIGGLSHDGRGVASIEGKKIFVHGALPGERVRLRLTGRLRRYDEGEVIDILQPSPHRVQPRCPHFGRCGGCALQHLDPEAQIAAKQDSLLQNLERIGKVRPERVLEPLRGPLWHYRRKARLSVRQVAAKQRVLVGFRERHANFVTDMDSCEVLDARVARLLPLLPALISSLQRPDRMPQIEMACGDRVCALVLRHLDPLVESDLSALRAFAQLHGIAILLQPGGPDSIAALEPAELTLDFDLPEFALTLEFGPADFVQVNAEVNRRMVGLALDLLQPEPQDRVLDLFCGLGNFTLPLARRAGSVTGVEGDAALIARARANARRNGLDNVSFHLADLDGELSAFPWLRQGFDKVLLDPPRSGAEAVLGHLATSGARRLVYVSCHPASLARDAGALVGRHGYTLAAAGVMDMFPHTGHVESITLFERGG